MDRRTPDTARPDPRREAPQDRIGITVPNRDLQADGKNVPVAAAFSGGEKDPLVFTIKNVNRKCVTALMADLMNTQATASISLMEAVGDNFRRPNTVLTTLTNVDGTQYSPALSFVDFRDPSYKAVNLELGRLARDIAGKINDIFVRNPKKPDRSWTLTVDFRHRQSKSS